MTRASVIIPCHNKAATLPLVVDSVLRQSVQDLEVLLLGDGVTDAARAAIEALVAADPRVRFLDFPKGPHHGEAYRHDAVMAATSDAIFYLCDDDLLLPEHVADLLTLLERATVVQSLNGYLRHDGTVASFAADLGHPGSVDPILDESIRFNSVSITGTAHRRSFYLEVGEHWETTPSGMWPDHHQFRRMARHPAYVGATSHRMTALQLPTSDGREDWSEGERLAELARWHEVVTAPDGQARVDDLHLRGLVADHALIRPEPVRLAGRIAELDAYVHELHLARTRDAEELTRVRAQLESRFAALHETLLEERERHAAERTHLRALLTRARSRRRALQDRVEQLESSRSWRLTAPLRALRQRVDP